MKGKQNDTEARFCRNLSNESFPKTEASTGQIQTVQGSVLEEQPRDSADLSCTICLFIRMVFLLSKPYCGAPWDSLL